MSKIEFQMKPVTEKREKTHLKGSKYDPIIDQFLDSGHNLVEITVEDKKAGYIVSNLRKRIEKRKLNIIASAASGFVYLEKS